MSGGEKKKPKKGYVSFDWEARGPHLIRHGMCGVGFVLFDENGAIVEEIGFGIQPVAGQQFDPKTKEEFWDKNPEALRWCETEAVPVEDAARRIVEFYQRAKQQFEEIKWLAWPSAPDWARLHFFLCTYFDGDYPIDEFKADCVSSMAEAYSIMAQVPKPDTAALGIVNESAHNPISDAKAQGLAYFALMRKMRAFVTFSDPELRRKIAAK